MTDTVARVEAPHAPVAERLTGIDALVRLLLEQAAADAAAGLRTGGFVSGYPGSPLGRLHDAFEARTEALAKHRIVHSPGLNEELAATAVWGSQTVSETPAATVDGVFGMWYGKAPGVDRAGDAMRHGNLRGTARRGGVLVVAGDDPHPNATVFPSDSTLAFHAWGMPVLFPAIVQDVLDLGRHGYALSRAAGVWVGMKIVTTVAEGTGTVTVEPVETLIPSVELGGAPFTPSLRVDEAGEPMREAERDLHAARLKLAAEYVRVNRLNPVLVDPPRARLGIVAAGPAYVELRAALTRLGLGDDELHAGGVRVKKVTALYPVAPEEWTEFADGLDEIVVVEAKRGLLETAIKDALYASTQRPVVVGQADEHGAELFPAHSELDAELIASRLRPRLAARFPLPATESEHRTKLPVLPVLSTARTGFFCSGCPHNTGLKAPAGMTVAGGIGCHLLALFTKRPEHGDFSGYTQMGGEGAQWVGMAPFTSTGHIVQNLGDGTFHHSGSLAVRLAVASGVNITYKILYNSAVGMTGGQDVRGGMDVPELTRSLLAEGVKRIVITTDDPAKYRGRDLPRGVTVRPREEIVAVQEDLAKVPGVTVLIHDQRCAADKRREQQRTGTVATKRIMVAQRVCEGCGDCNRTSQCLSVQPVATEFGRKTAIHQSSCNTDYTCADGDCPSFLTVDTSSAQRPQRRTPPAPPSVPDPTPLVPRDAFAVHMTGIGGTGVVSVGQLLAAAAAAEGRQVRTTDRTGATIKAGPVVTQLQVFDGREPSAAIGPGGADLFLAFDALTAVAPANLAPASAQRTIVIASTSVTPTAAMAIDPTIPYPEPAQTREALDAVSRAEHNVHLDAEAIARALFGVNSAGNALLVGAAVQAGALPLRAESVEQAITEQGVAVEQNLAAFRWGRAVVADPALIAGLLPDTAPPPVDARVERLVERAGAAGELARVLRIRLADLADYQSPRYARRYARAVADVARAERAAGGDGLALAVAHTLHRLMAYKDEYEVARLHLLASAEAAVEAEFGPGAKVSWNLHPPVLRYLGMHRKIRLGPWFRPVFVALRGSRRVRGTPLDVFGYARVRRVERGLVEHYFGLCAALAAGLTAGNHAARVELAGAAGEIRGYENIKLAAVRRYLSDAPALAAAADVAFDTSALAQDVSWT